MVVYFADEQRAGRGRGDHAWESAAGVGVCERAAAAEVLAARLPLLSAGCGLAAPRRFTLSRAYRDLRWPNDLLLPNPTHEPRKAAAFWWRQKFRPWLNLLVGVASMFTKAVLMRS